MRLRGAMLSDTDVEEEGGELSVRGGVTAYSSIDRSTTSA